MGFRGYLVWCFIGLSTLGSAQVTRGNGETEDLANSLHSLATALQSIDPVLSARVSQAAKTVSLDNTSEGIALYTNGVRRLLATVDWKIEIDRLQQVLEAGAAARLLPRSPSYGKYEIWSEAIPDRRLITEVLKILRAGHPESDDVLLSTYLLLRQSADHIDFLLRKPDAPQAPAVKILLAQELGAANRSVHLFDKKETLLSRMWELLSAAEKMKTEIVRWEASVDMGVDRIIYKLLLMKPWGLESLGSSAEMAVAGQRAIDLLSEAIRAAETGDTSLAIHGRGGALRHFFPMTLTVHRSDEELAQLLRVLLNFNYLKDRFRPAETESLSSLFHKILTTRPTDEFHSAVMAYRNRVAELIPSLDKHVLYQLTPYIAPEATARNLHNTLLAIAQGTRGLRKAFLDKKNMTYAQTWQTTYNNKVDTTLQGLEKDLTDLGNQAASGEDLNLLLGLSIHRPAIELFLGYIAEAAWQRSNNFDHYAELLHSKLNQIRRSPNEVVMTPEDVTHLRRWMNQDTKDFIRWNIYYTRQNAALVASCVLIIVEGITFQWEALPPTLAMVSAGAGVAARSVLIANAGGNLVERVHRSGYRSLLTVDSAIDTLTIFALTGRTIPRAAGMNQRLSLLEKVRNTYGLLQQDAIRLLSFTVGAVGAYEVAFAESVAKDLRERGMDVTAWDIRSRGIANLGLALAYRLVKWNGDRQNTARFGEAYNSEMNKLTFGQSFTGETLQSVWPGGWFQNFRRIFAANWNWGQSTAGKLWGKTSAIVKTTAMGGYLYVFVNEMFLFSYTTPDFIYDSHVDSAAPLPQLNDGEIAVIAVGLHPDDLLYAGARSKYFSRRELDDFGQRYHLVEFTSPKDLFDQLEGVSEEFGKIRYLKIVTHGLPGMLVTRQVTTTPLHPGGSNSFDNLAESGYINVHFLEANRVKLEKITTIAMAPKAHVVLVSCLVGSNYEKGHVQNGDDVGDRFLDLLSEVLLTHGGRLEASTRILLGLDVVYGSYLREGYADSAATRTPRLTVPIARFRPPSEGQPFFERLMLDDGMDLEAKEEHAGIQNVLKLPYLDGEGSTGAQFTMASQRLKDMVFNLHRAWWRYGTELEGGFWHTRFKSRVVGEY
ncbi:MAG: hypothetical protein HYR96_12750 [Deltaproteobacteria bacterium]|nr:hypothetical protein [Deltaproteobacteria bacterium]MBI3295056.1 hypothetical protein [Deltaproteobacteria bacterium]